MREGRDPGLHQDIVADQFRALGGDVGDAEAGVIRSKGEAQAKAAADPFIAARETRIEVQKKQFALLKEILIKEKAKVRVVAEQMNEMSRDDLRQKLLSLSEI